MRIRNLTVEIGIIFIFLLLSFSVNAQNLLVNPGAESGDTQGWVDPDNVWGAANEITPHEGDYFFWPSRQAIAYTEMYQDVDMSSYVTSIDNGSAWFNLSGWLANWDQYPHDRATLAIEALDAKNQQLLYLSKDHRSPVWTQYQIETKIPEGTRTLRVHLIATRFVGSDNDGYFDDLSLTVSTTAPTVYVNVFSDNNEIELPVGGSLQLDAQTTGASDTAYVWTSSFEAVATVVKGLVTASQSGRFTIQATGKNSDKTGYIELTAYNPDDIVFQTPQTDAQWQSGSTQEVTWEVKGSVSSGTLFYSFTGGSDWIEIAPIDTLISGHYFWSIPDTTQVVNNCFVKIDWGSGSSVSSKFAIVPVITAIGKENRVHIPAMDRLYPNYPNPFNPSTVIRYKVSAVNGTSQFVSLNVYDAYGQRVRALVYGRQSAGIHQVRFDASGLASGIYYYRLQTSGSNQIRKMILLR